MAARPTSDIHQMLVRNPARMLARPGSRRQMTMRTSIATVCLSGTLVEKLHACAEAGFDGVEIFEPDLVGVAGQPRGDRRPGPPAGADRRPLPAVPRCRGRHGGGLPRGAAPGPGEVPAHAAARASTPCSCAATSAPRPSTTTRSPPTSCDGSGTRPRRTASGWPTRRSPGVGTSTTTAGPGGSSSSPTTRRSGSASTASTSCPAATTPPASRRSRARRSSSSSSPTRRR